MQSSDRTIHVRALNGISFQVNQGDRLAIVGPNGAGKSSLLKVLAGIYEPQRGSIVVNGRVASMFDIGFGMDYEATGVENIKLLAAMRGYSPWRMKSIIDEIVDFSGLGGYANMPVRVYSSGMLARLLFSTATSFDHEILLLEEWLSAGDASFIAKATERMQKLVTGSRALVTATHSMHLARSLCNKVLRLEHGKIVFFGDIEDYVEPPALPHEPAEAYA